MLADAARTIDSPGLVIALSHRGHRTLRHGAVPPGDVPRDRLHYELGSASKPFTGLLLAALVAAGRVRYEDSAAGLLAPGHPVHPAVRAITLRHLITHTSGLPGAPADFYPQALPRWSTAPYSGYPADRVVRAFLRARPRHRPGTRWHYSNFAVSVLGHTLAAATGTPWEALLQQEVLGPLGLDGTRPRPGPPGSDAVGHRRDGGPVPALDTGGFTAAGAVRATPLDLLTFLEAHLPGAVAPTRPLAAAFAEVRRPLLRRGLRHAHTHTLTWFRHPSPRGPVYFHAGATLGQQAFLGFRPDTGTAVAAVTTRRVHRTDPFIATIHGLLMERL
ncbi:MULTISPECIES: serine hydrolase [unclassified Streptomyces]|uniref:serine hydrolase domain-containing protein n=1 Tax=unclassified Streptomyces TaxID=2593676 RepID=UPI00093B9C28|nr:serine hydrolase domain-containing protein [Streptomyces sp. TSRI0281]OKI35160.1 penicillin-binding protein [Streptomyces sp. TSRI0281]